MLLEPFQVALDHDGPRGRVEGAAVDGHEGFTEDRCRRAGVSRRRGVVRLHVVRTGVWRRKENDADDDEVEAEAS